MECARARTKRRYNVEYYRELYRNNKEAYKKRTKERSKTYFRDYIRKPVVAAKYQAVYSQRIKHRRLGDKWDDVLTWIYLDRPEGYVCDHIEPLDGETSSGLHTPWNLQYLLHGENARQKKSLTEYEAKSAIEIDWKKYINKPLP